jgi:hypothetical protein
VAALGSVSATVQADPAAIVHAIHTSYLSKRKMQSMAANNGE